MKVHHCKDASRFAVKNYVLAHFLSLNENMRVKFFTFLLLPLSCSLPSSSVVVVTHLAEKLVETLMTVRLVILFLERACE